MKKKVNYSFGEGQAWNWIDKVSEADDVESVQAHWIPNADMRLLKIIFFFKSYRIDLEVSVNELNVMYLAVLAAVSGRLSGCDQQFVGMHYQTNQLNWIELNWIELNDFFFGSEFVNILV